MLPSPTVRIAVSGTHCSGKSTLIEDFLAAHGNYHHEPEPYEWLDDMAEEPSAHDFYRQLEVCVDRLRNYGRGENVIAERSPVDFLAYLTAITDLGRSARDCQLMDSAAELAAEGMANIDLLVILPLNDRDGIAAPESEDLELRSAMNDCLLDLITTDPYSLFNSVRIVEIHGARHERMRVLETKCV